MRRWVFLAAFGLYAPLLLVGGVMAVGARAKGTKPLPPDSPMQIGPGFGSAYTLPRLVIHSEPSAVWLTVLMVDDCLVSPVLRRGNHWPECPSPRHVRMTLHGKPGVFLEINREDATLRICKGDLVFTHICEPES